jgi:hypothetical protein
MTVGNSRSSIKTISKKGGAPAPVRARDIAAGSMIYIQIEVVEGLIAIASRFKCNNAF